MKKKFYLVAALLGAMTLGTSCVDDQESASVTAVRTAKAEQLSALATKAKAEAEAALITANAEKAYKEAAAKYQEALTKQKEEEIAQAKEKFEAELAALKAEYEARIKAAQLQAMKAEQDLMNEAANYLQTLYIAYSRAAEDLAEMRAMKVDKEYNLARMEAYLLNINEYIAAETAKKQGLIAEKEADIEAWKTYAGIDKSTLETKQRELIQQKYAAYKIEKDAEVAEDAAEKAFLKVVAPYYKDFKETSPVKAVAAVQELYKYATQQSVTLEVYRRAIQKGYVSQYAPVDYSQGDYRYVTLEAWGGIRDEETGMYLPVAPLGLERAKLIEGEQLFAPKYILSNLSKEVVTRYFDNYAEETAKYLEWVKKENASDEAELANQKAALTKLEASFAGIEKAYLDADAAKKAMETQKDEVQKAYDAINLERQGYQEALDKAERELNAAEAEWNAQQRLISQYTQEKDGATAQEKADTKRKEGLEKELKVQVEALKTATAEQKPAIEQAIKDLNAELEQVNQSLAEQKAIIQRATAKITAAEQASKEAEAAKATAEKAIATAEAQINGLSTKYQDASEAWQAAQRKLEAAQAEYYAAYEKYATAEAELNQVKANITALVDRIAQAKDQLIYQEQQAERAPAMKAAWNEVLANLNADYDKQMKALAEQADVKAYLEAQKALQKAQKDANKINAELNTVNEMLNDHMVKDPAQEIEKLQAAITQLKKDIEELKLNYYAGDMNAEMSERLIAQTKAEIEALTESIAIQEKMVAAAKKRVDDYLAQSGK